MTARRYIGVLDDLRAAYDAQVAARDRAPLEPWKEPLRAQFLARLQAEQRRTLVDLGAGPGIHGRYFADAGIDVVCTDLSPAMVEACRAKGLEAVESDFLRLPERLPHRMDAAFAMNCLLHVPPDDLPRVLEAIHDVLEPDGLFFLGQYGGIDFHDVRAQDTYQPKRYFSFLPDAHLRTLVEVDFQVLDFQVVELPGETEPGFHFQALLLRRRWHSRCI
jgi:SAM-dependent methyltransferase